MKTTLQCQDHSLSKRHNVAQLDTFSPESVL